MSSELLMCGGGVRVVFCYCLLCILLMYGVCLCKGCDGCCVFFLFVL